MPAAPGQPERYDNENRRAGARNLFLLFSPLVSRWHVKVTELRTHFEWAHCMNDLLMCILQKEHVFLSFKIISICNTWLFFYEVFEPTEARLILDTLDFPFTPKHGIWFNMAEIEFSVLSRQCLNRYIEDEASLIQEIQSWQEDRNKIQATVDWQFSIDNARIILKQLYSYNQ
jgi:hypothetical protein